MVPLFVIGLELSRAPATEVLAELPPPPAHLAGSIWRRLDCDVTHAEVGLLREVPEAGLDLLDLPRVYHNMTLQ
jgi:hypothetical protein